MSTTYDEVVVHLSGAEPRSAAALEALGWQQTLDGLVPPSTEESR